jgi:hypothetical protein
MRGIVHRISVIFKYARYAVAALASLYAIFVLCEVAFMLMGGKTLPPFNLSDHITDDQQCMVRPIPAGCPGNR